MQATIFANGELSAPERARDAVAAAQLVLAADGGARHCRALGVTPGIVIGDLDSLTPQQLEQLRAQGSRIERYPAQKDQTDLELALLYAKEQGADRIVVLGAVGGRLDMTIANLLLLADPRLDGLRIELWHADQTAWLIRPPGGAIDGKPGDTVSLIPLAGPVEAIVTQDLQYPLRNEPLQPGPARGVSNVVSGPHPGVQFRSGTLLAVCTPSGVRVEQR